MRGESTEPAPGAGSPGVRESCIVLALCAAAAARVLVYALGFPVFDNLDEAKHFDLVLAYAQGRMPRAIEPIGAEAAPIIALYASPEFLSRPGEHPDGRYPPPLWAQPPDRAAPQLARYEAFWRTTANQESLEPPLYYAVAAAWLEVARWLGLAPGSQIYWIRALDVPCAAALVWLAYATSRSVFPERRFVRIGAPALIALLPQDSFYSIHNDVLSPLCFGAAFLAVLRFTQSARPRADLGAGIGLALAATALTKTSNLPLVAVASLVVLADLRRRAAAGTLRDAAPALAWLCACAALPLGAWMIRNQIVLGELTGSADKIAALDWTRKPVGEWWPHPIFTPRGLGYFLRENTVTFWRGEFVWGGRRLASPAADAGYVLSTALCLAATALGLLPRFRRPARERRALGFAFASLLAPLAALGRVRLRQLLVPVARAAVLHLGPTRERRPGPVRTALRRRTRPLVGSRARRVAALRRARGHPGLHDRLGGRREPGRLRERLQRVRRVVGSLKVVRETNGSTFLHVPIRIREHSFLARGEFRSDVSGSTTAFFQGNSPVPAKLARGVLRRSVIGKPCAANHRALDLTKQLLRTELSAGWLSGSGYRGRARARRARPVPSSRS